MEKRRKRMRHPGFDYAADSFYFITSCVNGRIPYLGTVESGCLHLNHYGQIADAYWTWLEEQYGYLQVHAHITMPDHIHALVEINRRLIGSDDKKIKPVPEWVGAYKTSTSKAIHLAGGNDFQWQRSYYLRVIFGIKAIRNVMQYIYDNPKNWSDKQVFPA